MKRKWKISFFADIDEDSHYTILKKKPYKTDPVFDSTSYLMSLLNLR